jgi:polysaccharide deacetylase 2 family uncharacterized protein YibQ
VVDDELNAPLGQAKRKRLPKPPISGIQLLAGVFGLFGLAILGWAVFGNDPLGGEPHAIVATAISVDNQAKNQAKNQAETKPGEHRQASHDEKHADKPNMAAAPGKSKAEPPPGSKTVTIIDGSSGQRRNIIIPGKDGSGAATMPVDPKLLESTRHGLIPKAGVKGARPFVRYAQAREIPPAKKDWPRIAIVVGGIGVSASGTDDAFTKLPAPVTFALSPYATGITQLVERARALKHEVLLQAPMEPLDYPDSDPGPQTLLTSATTEQNLDRLHWLMSRCQGYVGIVGYMGAKFTATEQSLAPVLREVAKRGLIFVDDGASSRSLASQIAGSHNLPFAKSGIVIDAVPTPKEIDQALARLEMKAREHGSAVALATALPATVARIASWAKSVEGRGFVLVPITMVTVKAKSS